MDNRRLILAFVLSAAILFGFQWLVPAPVKPPIPPHAAEQAAQTAPGESSAPRLPALGNEPPAPAPASRQDVIAASQRVTIQTPVVSGSIALKGARLDDLTLLDFHETIDPASPAIVLLSPSGARNAYFSDAGWIATTPGAKVPGAETVWTADGSTLGVNKPVTLTWDNGEGLVFTRKIAIDDHYMFTVEQSVTNSGSASLTLKPFALVARTGAPPVSASWVSYEGPIAVLNGVEADFPYASVTGQTLESCGSTRGFLFFPNTDGNSINCKSAGGWLGFSDKYWLGAVMPADQKAPVQTRLSHSGTGDAQVYQFDYLGEDEALPPGGTVHHSTLLFAGPKEVRLLADYSKDLGIPRLENSVDFGMFWFFTKPIFYGLDMVYKATGNFGIAILVLTIVMRALFFPLQTRAVLSMNKMKVLQPQIAELREKYADDKVRLNQESMELYKRAGANPLAGCLPVLVQIPVFFSLYKVLFVTIEMRHAPFFGWIRDLSAPDPTSIWQGFGLIPWTPPHFLPAIGVWPVIYCVSMLLQQRMQPKPADPVQARMMQWMPLFFTFMLGNFPAGLVIYWSWSNCLVLLQQYIITRHIAVVRPAKT